MLEQMRERLLRCGTFEQAIWVILDDAIALHGAECGNMQLLTGDELVIVAQRHLSPDFLNAFRFVKKDVVPAGARALLRGASVVIADVEGDAEFAPFRNIMRGSRVRAVQSTPLVTEDGRCLGVLSTYFVNPHQPTKIEMETLQAYGKIAAQYIFELLGDAPLATIAARMSDELYSSKLAPG